MSSAVAIVRATVEEARRIGGARGPGSDRVARALLDDLQTADRLLAKKLRRLQSRNLGDRFSGAQAAIYARQVRHAIDEVQAHVDGVRVASSTTAADAGIRATADLIEGLEERFRGVAAPLGIRQAERLVPVRDRALGARARYVATSLDRYGADMIADFEKILRVGILSGATTQEVIDAMTGHGGPRGTVSLAARVTPAGVIRTREAEIPEGLFARHRYWAERLVRTEMAAAYNGAKLESLREESREFPDMGKKILAVLDDRTAPDSLYVHGQIRELDELFEDGAGRRYLHPPGRPNDRETIIPWRMAWNEGPAKGQRPLTLAERALVAPETLTDEERATLAAGATGTRPPRTGPRALGAGAKRRAPKPPAKAKPMTPDQQLRARVRAELWADGPIIPTPTWGDPQGVVLGGVRVGTIGRTGPGGGYVFSELGKVVERADTVEALRAQVEDRLRKRIDSRVKKLRVTTPEELRSGERRQAEILAEIQGIRQEAIRAELSGGIPDDTRARFLRLQAEWRELDRLPDRSLVQSMLATAGYAPRALVLPKGVGYTKLRKTGRGAMRNAVATFTSTSGEARIMDGLARDQVVHALIHEELHGVGVYTARQSRHVGAALALEEATVESVAIGLSGGEGLGWSAYDRTIVKVHAELRAVLGADDRPFARAVHAASSPTEVREVVAELGRRMRTGPISAADYVDHVIASVPGITETEAAALRRRFADLSIVMDDS